jgi:multisubunit Na+/H+ antiporter MnhG subunit
VTALVDALLVALVAVTWLGCLGFARLRDPLDRLHCAAFVNVAAGAVLVAAVFLADGPSTRAWKTLLTVLASVGFGAALSHAAGRALLYRARFARPEPPT